ncbi:MFS transporter [Flexivirga caeni]|uniref:MFS transporter n=1 Tax=Flexivirga caeni TaxID=2294115 RepID=A0A3M9MC52_9MICO|nr:MFS transporter [Flexivirga caeni]RNI22765.1 hypothetical protein EFY87_08045 [Flexivirga caeni]
MQWLFAADAASSIACLVLVAGWLPRTPPPPVQQELGTSRSAWKDGRLWLLMTTGTLFATVYMLIPMAMPLALAATGRPASDAGLLSALGTLITIAAQPLMRRSENITSRIVAGYLLLAAGLAVAGLHPAMTGYVGATIIIAAGDTLLVGYTYTLVAAIAPAGSRARYFAVYGLTWGVALTVGPPAIGTLVRHGFAEFWLVCAAAMCATGLGQLLVNRMIRPRPCA